MSGTVEVLVKLGAVLQEIAHLKNEIASLPDRMAEIETKLQDARSRVEGAQAAIKKEEAARRGHESDIQDRNNKIIRLREQSSSVKTNEQYKALLAEIAFLEKEITQAEEKILLIMEQHDGLKAALKSAEEELKADAAEIEKEKEHARSVTAADEKRLAELHVEREELRKHVDADTLTMFERVAGKRPNPIVEAIDQKCSACNVRMRPQRHNELMKGDQVVTCESCARILFHDPAHDAPQGLGIRPSDRGQRAWYSLPEWKGKPAFALLSNGKDRSTMRVFDALTGSLLERSHRKNQAFRAGFAQELGQGAQLDIQMHGSDDEPENLDAGFLEELQQQAGLPAPR